MHFYIDGRWTIHIADGQNVNPICGQSYGINSDSIETCKNWPVAETPCLRIEKTIDITDNYCRSTNNISEYLFVLLLLYTGNAITC